MVRKPNPMIGGNTHQRAPPMTMFVRRRALSHIVFFIPKKKKKKKKKKKNNGRRRKMVKASRTSREQIGPSDKGHHPKNRKRNRQSQRVWPEIQPQDRTLRPFGLIRMSISGSYHMLSAPDAQHQTAIDKAFEAITGGSGRRLRRPQGR